MTFSIIFIININSSYKLYNNTTTTTTTTTTSSNNNNNNDINNKVYTPISERDIIASSQLKNINVSSVVFIVLLCKDKKRNYILFYVVIIVN